jgi:hypothetical protein
VILLISASWVAGITDVSHQHWAPTLRTLGYKVKAPPYRNSLAQSHKQS